MAEFTDSDNDSGTFREGTLALCPPWLLTDPRYMYTHGVNRDGIAEWFRLGVLQRFPDHTDAAGLAHLGRDKKIFRGRAEGDASYATRLRQYVATWRYAGNAPTLLRQLYPLLAPDAVRIRYVCNGYDSADGTADGTTQYTDWWTIDDTGLTHLRVSPSNWDWDSDAIGYGKQARFWLIVYRAGFNPPVWGVAPPSVWGEPGYYWGTGVDDRDWIRDAYEVTRTFRAAGSSLGPWTGHGGGLIIANPDTITSPWGAGGPFDPTLPPGYPMPDGDFNSPSNRPPGAIYLSGM